MTAAATLVLSACGPGAGDARGNAANPAPDPERAAAVNGTGPDGQPIDAVTAAEMDAADLPPLKGAAAPASPGGQP
ncbi:MAG: hypothetical protein ACK4E3_07240 [Brevundimonas sp.]|uniref:hypothetical protein n=1 Tax=Brevundimonas sp. TaxID=1871086 RepID=UPI00391B4E91